MLNIVNVNTRAKTVHVEEREIGTSVAKNILRTLVAHLGGNGNALVILVEIT